MLLTHTDSTLGQPTLLESALFQVNVGPILETFISKAYRTFSGM
jgi:hypothetical protein